MATVDGGIEDQWLTRARRYVAPPQVAVQARPIPNGYLLSWRGAFARTQVYTAAEATYARLMPVKVAADTGKKLLCPMPGLVKSIAVSVKAGLRWETTTQGRVCDGQSTWFRRGLEWPGSAGICA